MMRLSTQRPFTALPKRQQGAALVLVVIALASILLMGALALDGGHMLVNKTRLQNAVDAAALSGAKTLMMVSGATGAASVTQSVALDTLKRNALATGNEELATAIGNNLAGFATVELASSVYGPFSFPGPADASFVRVSVPNYPLTGFFWGILQATGNGSPPNKAVAAIATAGPSPTSPCDLVPLMVCGDPAQYNPGTGNFWSYHFGDLTVLKSAAGGNPQIGPGNFQLLDFGNGGKSVGDQMAGGIHQCNSVGSQVTTKPGNTVGPAAEGFNTRFNQYKGSFKNTATVYPPDLVTTTNPQPFTYTGSYQYNGKSVTSTNGNLSSNGTALLGYNDWVKSSADCVATGSNCTAGGVFGRRMLKIVVGDCTGKNDGSSSIPVLGFGCFFALQPMPQGGSSAQIFGQFINQCESDNVSGPNPANDTGPQIIQLYKTYIDNSQTPSTDS
jgi:hypothetical protein